MSGYELQPLQTALIALLPKTGEGRTVAELAQAAAITREQVVGAMLMPYMGFHVDFDVLTDSYSICREPCAAGRTDPITDSPSERKDA